MQHLTTVLHLCDYAINDDEWLGIDHIGANAANLHVVAKSSQAATLAG